MSALTHTIARRWSSWRMQVARGTTDNDARHIAHEASAHVAEEHDSCGRRSPRASWVALGLIALLAVSTVLRCYRLGYYSLWLDETTTYIVAAKPYGEILDQVYANHIFFHYALFHWFISLHLDGSAWLLRFPSMVAGVGAVWAIWDIGWQLFGEAEGWVAGILAALWPALIIYSQEYREYSLFVLFCTASCAFLLRGLRTGKSGWWIAFALAMVLNLDNTFLAVLNAVGLALFAVIRFVGEIWLVGRRTRDARAMWREMRAPFWEAIVAALPGITPAKRRLWALVTIRPHDYTTLQRAAGNDFEVHCYQQICAMRGDDPAGTGMRPQVQRFVNLLFLWRPDLRDSITQALG